ncbi:MAG: hypothetical protein Ta2A_00530 [Treponemataceae bacterium]|nr:MAG: hypothetical protein Ta2A_00530 [Treponemataceae bacterium]
MPDFIPKAALAYIKNKNLKTGFSYKDVWHEEHASAFTVAKAMQLDVLSDLQGAVTAAVENGQSFDTFKKSIKPTLQNKGWWGKKEMTDPLTGETVNAQLGSDRRLKTIYRVNMRSAYQKGQYERTMESELHPYLMYCIGPSIHHRKDHKSWDGLILPKDDPWWDAHLPPNGWGCKCYTRAVSETRKKKYETEGIPVPPGADGSGGGTLKVKTDAPPVTYRTFFNERRGTVERVPNGVDPAFNWNVGKDRRNTSALQMLVEKTQEIVPKQFDGVINSALKNSVNKKDFYGFIEDALERKINRQHVSAVGFLDTKITKFLETKKINLKNNSLVILESKLVNGKKYGGKHTLMGNAPTKEDWYNLVDWLLDAAVFWDGKGLVYLAKLDTSRFMKIAVDIGLQTKSHRGIRLLMPKIDTMYVLDLSAKGNRGSNEYSRILKMKKIR